MFFKLLGALLLFAICADVGLAQPAPILSSVSVVAVRSTRNPSWDYPRGALVTPADHSGPELVVVTYDDGYSVANSQKAKFMGLTMQSLGSERYPLSGPIRGYFRYWYIRTPFTSGHFSYEAVSINTGRKQSTSILIK